MAITKLTKGGDGGGRAVQQLQEEDEEKEELELSLECKQLLASLPKEKGWRTRNLFLYQGFWCQPKQIQAIMSFQNHFQPQDGDILVASIPKSGTTWLKALTFAIVNRHKFSPSPTHTHPLYTSNPHDLVPFLEYKLYVNNNLPDLSSLPRPRLLATHVPFTALPESMMNSITPSSSATSCKIVYICRNPFDTFISAWHFLSKLRPESLGPMMPLEEAFDMYCKGVIGFGPYWDHMLGYWTASLDNPNKVLFLKYEDMKKDINSELKKLADFLGFPFSPEEEKQGAVDDISSLCSFQNLKELEVNKKGKGAIADFENRTLFRKAEVGDWANHLTPAMVERLAKLMEEKLRGSTLSFKVL